jgi:hypothetical protein
VGRTFIYSRSTLATSPSAIASAITPAAMRIILRQVAQNLQRSWYPIRWASGGVDEVSMKERNPC